MNDVDSWSQCYVRVPHPTLSSVLLAHFARPESPIALELVQGDRESIYWRSNVKEPIRLEAVRVASGATEAAGEGATKGGGKRRKM